MAILETKDLRKIYGSGENEVHALDGVSISVEEGEFVAVIGTSGSGKSTLLNMIGGLDRPTSGSVTIRGKELLKMKDEELTIFRRRNIGFVFQNYNLLPVLNVYENIVYPIEIDGGKTDTRFVKHSSCVTSRKKRAFPHDRTQSGCACRAVNRSFRAAGTRRSSASRKRMNSPREWRSPVLRAAETPVFACLMTRKRGSRADISWAIFGVASVDPSSIIRASHSWYVCAITERHVSSR